MRAKVITKRGGTSDTYDCEHVHKDTKPDGKIEVVIHPQGVSFTLQERGDAVYEMNEQGDTTDCLRWPGRIAQQSELRVLS